MAISQAMCTSFKQGLLDGTFNFSSGTGQVFKIALYTSSATLGAATTAYTTSDEITGTGYTALGKTLTIGTHPTTSGTTAYLDFDDVTWSSASITSRGALIYMYNGGTNPAIAGLEVGADKTSSAGAFKIVMPTADASNAIIRLA